MSARRRGAELEEALLDAAWDQLVEHGYAAFTMDAVADRARTSRPVLYRRWADRHELVRAALGHHLANNLVRTPDTGSLRGDVLAVMREVNATRVHLSTVMSVTLAGYYQETGTSPAELKSLLSAGRRSLGETIYGRAVDRGEVDPARVTERLKTLPFDLLRHELLMTQGPVPDDVLVEIVDTLFLPLIQGKD